jgi:alkylation response protein AidB-like acyl-CoA dehydrogenase
MDFSDTEAEAAYRVTLRAWLEEQMRTWKPSADEHDTTATRQWMNALFEAGYVAQTWSREEGGKGLPPTYEVILNEEVARCGAPSTSANINYLGRAILKFGTEDQKRQFFEPSLRGDIQWCQGFSEPEAGSDLASMRTKAVLEGDEWVINGQKLWTSGAATADWCFLLARTEPEDTHPRHKGISVFLVDMKTPGVTARGVRTSDNQVHTGETFWDNVRVPKENMLGARGQGWKVAMWALQFERGPADIGIIASLWKGFRDLENRAREAGVDVTTDARRAISKAYVDLRALDLNATRQLTGRESIRPAGSDGPVVKLLWAKCEQSLGHAWLNVLGPQSITGEDNGHAVSAYFWTRPASVYGGSSQVQRNLLSQRFLGMPTG